MTTTRTRIYDRDGILTDLAAGHRQQDVAAKYGVSKSLVSRLAIGHGLRRHSERPEQACASCGHTTRSPVRICRPCQRANKYPEPTAADALTGGQWVLDQRRRVMVWDGPLPKPGPTTRDEMNELRREDEDAHYDDLEARCAHSAYVQGDGSEWAVVGHRVYSRRLSAERAAKKAS